MIEAKNAKAIADASNNKFNSSYLKPNDLKIFIRFINLVIEHAKCHNYEMFFKTEEPMSVELHSFIVGYGYKVELEGFKYRISWRGNP